MSESVPESVAQRETEIGGIRFVMHILDDGRRVIDSAGMHEMIRQMESGKFKKSDAIKAIAWVKGDA